MATTGIVNGTALVVYIGGVAYAHATSHTLNINHAARDATTKDSAGWKANLDGLRDWSIDGEALFAYDASNGFSELFALITSRAAVTLKFSTEVTGDKRYTGSARLTALNSQSPTEDNVTYSFSFEGTGALTEETVT